MIRRQRGSTTIIAVIASVLVALASFTLYSQLSALQKSKEISLENNKLVLLKTEARELLANPEQCARNLGPGIAYPESAVLADLSFQNTDGLSFFNTKTDTVIKTVVPAATAPESFLNTIQISNVRSKSGSLTNLVADLTLKVKATSNISLFPLVNHAGVVLNDLNIQVRKVGANYQFSGCLLGPSATRSYAGKLIGSRSFSMPALSPPLGSSLTDTQNIKLSDIPAATMIDMNASCTIFASRDSGVKIELIVSGASGPIMTVTGCEQWAPDERKVSNFKTGSFFRLPADATELDIVFTATAGSSSGGGAWYASSEINFFE